MFIPIPIKAKWAVLGLAAFDLFGGVANFRGDNVAHFAHLGGAITGFIIVLIWNRRNRRRFY
jgi:membrane associated rhomboid family serine protease